MGSWIVDAWKTRVKPGWKTAFFSAFGIGLLVHMFKLVNVLPYWDSLMNHYSSQNMVASGRWFLSVACSLGSRYDLPWVNGILSLLFLGLTAAVIAEHFRLESPVLIVICSGVLVTFPAVTTTFAYAYTADGYMLAMLLAALGASLSTAEAVLGRKWKRLLLSSLLICLSCGIYQAYVSFAFAMAVARMIPEILDKKHRGKDILLWIGAQILIFGCALAAYYGIWKLCLTVQGVEVSRYQGIDAVGLGGAAGILIACGKVLRDMLLFVCQWDIFEHGLTLYALLNILVFLALCMGIIIAAVRQRLFKEPGVTALLALLLISLPFGCFMWHFASPGVYYHPVMLQSLCVLFILTAVVFDSRCRGWQAEAVAVLLTAVILNNSVSANIFYDRMHLQYERTYAEAVELQTRLHLLDDGTVRYIAFCGEPDRETVDRETYRALGGCWLPEMGLTSYHFLLLYTDTGLRYYEQSGEPYPLVEDAPGLPVPSDQEFRFPLLPAQERVALEASDAVQNMPVWPAEGSVCRIGDVIVVRYS